MLSSILCPASAAADPIADKREEAARIARQLEQQSRQVSMLAEDYDEARVRIAEIDRELVSASAKVAKTDAQASAIKRRLTQQAVEAYIRGGSSQALSLLADTKANEDIAVRAQYVRTVTSGAADVLDELRAIRGELDYRQRSLDAAKAAAADVAALAESKRRQAAAAESAQRATLQQVQGELSALVAAETKRRADEESRRVQAELAARRAREEAAASEAAARDAARRATTTSRPGASAPVVTPKATTTTRPPTTTTQPDDPDAPPPSPGADAAVAEAKRQLGKPYQYGGSGPDTFDCSGLTAWAWRAGGKTLPHSSRSQWSATSRVAISEILPGDIVFYGDPIHHVGLYVGNGQMVEASQTGTPVRYASIYRRDLVGAGRVN